MSPLGLSFPRLTAGGLLLFGWAFAANAETATGWSEVQTPHVTLKSDLHPDDARRAALAVERTRAALLAAAWPGAQLLQPEHIEVIVFSNHQDFERYFGTRVGAVFIHGTYPPTAFLYGTPEKWEHRETLALEETTSTLKHELTHHLAAYIYRRQPRWFSEGLAQFLETMRVSEEGKTATLGDVNLQGYRDYNTHRTLTVADALAWSGKLDAQDEATTAGLYGISWLLVHWLYNTHPEEFARYQTLLVKGIDPDKAWKAVFGTLATSDIDTALNLFSHHGEYRNVSVSIPEADVRVVRARPMTSAEVHATRATSALAAAGMQVKGAAQFAEAQAELGAALADDPGNVRALLMRMGMVKPEERMALGRRAAEAHPDDGLAWLALAQTLTEAPGNWDESVQALKKATELLPDNPTAFNNLAWMYVQKGRAPEALPLAITAARMAPWDAFTLDTLAAALAGVGRCSEAVTWQTQAVDMLPERAGASLRADFAKRVTDLQHRCTEAAALPPALPAGTPKSTATPTR